VSAQALEGKVFECVVTPQDADALCENYPVINVRQEEKGVFLRLIGENKPCDSAVNVPATLEDLYLYYFSGVSKP